MASINKVILVGNLGADPESRTLASGDLVCNLRVATSDKWKDKTTGEPREATEWHRIVLFRSLAQIASRYLKKGDPIYVEGKLRTRKWQGNDGLDRYTTEIEAVEFKMLGGRRQDTGPQEIEMRQDARQGPTPNNLAVSRDELHDWMKDVPF
jgi:single-strand DNA-binding protein